MFTRTRRVVRYRYKKYERGNSESGYLAEPERVEQHLVETIKLGKLTVWKRTIDKETVPFSVVVSLGAYGDTGGWTSKFAKYIK